MEQLSTFEQVFDELGKVPGLVDLTGKKPGAVGAWQTHRRFPWKVYPIVTGALAARGKIATGDIWGLKGKDKAA